MQRTNRWIHVLIGPFILFVLVMCARSEDINQNIPGSSDGSQTDVKTVILVFADLTTSADSAQHIEALAKNVHDVIISASYNADVMIRPIDRQPSVKPIADIEVPQPLRNRAARAKLKRDMKQRADTAKQEVKNLYNEVYHGVRTESISCIIRSLETAHNHFNRYRQHGGRYRFVVLYLSDMIEECDNTPGGAVHMTRGKFFYPRSLRGYTPTFKLDYADIYVVTSIHGHASESPAIPPEHLMTAWKDIFARVGVTQERLVHVGASSCPSLQNVKREDTL